MLDFFIWYLILTALGLLTFPLAYKMLPALADRGYAFSRSLGLLLWGFVFWLLGSLGLLRNDLGGELFALLVLILLSVWAIHQTNFTEILDWLRAQRRFMLTVEILFFLAFLGWATIRGMNPDIVGTEKPMELAFINAILRSPAMPPNDPWLSGYAISYYYFGYVLVAMLARLVGTPASIAFNLALSMIFALAAIGSFGLLYNLLSHNKIEKPSSPLSAPRSPLSALLGPFFLLIVSNFGGLLHILRINRVFWRQTETGEWVSPLWAWLDMGRYAAPPPAESFPHWWWWQASRIVQDFYFDGVTNRGDIIDEFPFFSFLLGDLHPHVLAMPFALLAIALAWNLFRGGAQGKMKWFGLPFEINGHSFALAAIVLGALAFFNTWDFPFYVALFVGAFILWRLQSSDAPSRIGPYLRDFFGLGFALGVTGALLYLPFFISFSSQAGGPLPNIIYVTKGIYTWLMFGILLVPLFAFLLHLYKSAGERQYLKNAFKLTWALVSLLILLVLLLILAIANIQILQSLNADAAIAADAFLGSVGVPNWSQLVAEGLIRRFTIPGTLLTVVALLTLTLSSLWPRLALEQNNSEDTDTPTPLLPSTLSPASIFTLLLILIGALLILAPEFVFLRDFFGYRINTIFKFYYQTWILWSLTAAFATVTLWQKLAGTWKWVFRIGFSVLLIASLTYPMMGLWSKTGHFNTANWTLDGTAHLEQFAPDEAAAMDWLAQAPLGVVAESVGGSYSAFARMSANSGQPAVLGWDFHELQWRGGGEEMGSRKDDIETLYCTMGWSTARDIITRYDITYVVVGGLERSAYEAGNSDICSRGLQDAKFTRFLELVFQQGGVTIYQVPEILE